MFKGAKQSLPLQLGFEHFQYNKLNFIGQDQCKLIDVRPSLMSFNMQPLLR